MWPRINESLKRNTPWLHAFLKRHVAAWRFAAVPLFPAFRRVRGEFFWAHPLLLTAGTHDNEPHISGWVVDHLRPGGVFFDVGAHYGWLSMKAARHVGRNGRVIAFEPSPVLFDILQYHQRRNRLRQMTVVRTAISERDAPREKLYLLNRGFSSRNSLTIGAMGLPFLDTADKSAVEVSTMKLDSFCEAKGIIPDVIKIDVEGAEGMVLRGAGDVLRKFRPALVMSTHPYWLPAGETVEQLFDFLRGYGYETRDAHVVDFEGYKIGDYLLCA